MLGLERSIARGRGIEFHSMREFQDSDSPRDIDWMASARLSDDDLELVSREFMPEHQIRVLVVADEHASMRYPSKKPLYAEALVELLGRAAHESGNSISVVGVGGEGMIYSGWMSSEEDVRTFLDSADEQKRRPRLRASAHTFAGLLDELRLKNTLVVFVTDFLELERIPLDALRAINPAQNVKSVAVVFDEWSGFAPIESALALRSPEGDAFATLDMRKGGSLEREVNAFRGRVAELKRRGRTCNLSVVTVPLVEEDPLRNFQKQWQQVMEEDN
ncbi:hypothetical protein A2673_03425 [Candidatus Kaiserbacteria bacterium RIFCSPHIGHO2_01_FULL_50_13]|uniref:DUF58 domain-containing protein n=1 Tax=Candidatus Kaiserbacteria bacterium RIFCSPLOWO2_01_FULL_50_24 TaxID=1798507 RepID=A0A1F6EMK8_9BACT|nr:MAG: hypothetical protein A2673_03425 [Candidatus Kaiserbacteria bacterium RIFCSPHIGHO2_01_FULL_50_13]OGG74879.1 MAG: hypothetical protein A3A34_03605 [Candidatus Kaiserbacteria bacterium RIFCSPLOWO2_01_FULL_50_24]OGG81616.1 MAG: hypothetical protein A3H74_01385 [Candidatus Kaiserbacteria bacterium RIFCSPLOWO2_02_FULL_51_13]